MNAPQLMFLPAPRRLSFTNGNLALEDGLLVLLDSSQPQALRAAGSRFLNGLQKVTGLQWQLTASRAVPTTQVGLILRVAPERAPQPQGYRLHVTPTGIVIEGHDEAGVFYGVCTLIQAIEQVGKTLPYLEIQDWPDIAARGVMLDISRDKVFSMPTLYELVDRLAGWKINQLQLYTEHTFAYRNHQEVWEHASPMTGEEVMALDAYCRERFIELVPNQNSFGHMARWLIHPRYAHLAELHGEIVMPWGKMQGPFSLAPEHPGSIELITGLYDELLPHFTSCMFNVGCDETFDLGQGATKAACEQRGSGRVYLEYLLKIYADVKRRGYTMQFWGDIILQHPELVPLLPRDVIALSWGYEAIHPFAEEGAAFAASGVPFYVCPGTSAWNTLAGRTNNSLNNLLNAAENGVKYGAIGYLNTDWGDNGHWQVPAVSYLGYAAGAALSWAVEANRANDWPALVGRFAFDDPSLAMGRVAYDLGNVYDVLGFHIPNSSPLFWVLYNSMTSLPGFISNYGLTPGDVKNGMESALDAIDSALEPLTSAQMTRPDADLIRREYTNTARLMRHACRRALLALSGDNGKSFPAEKKALAEDMQVFLDEYRQLWLSRNRPGGLRESVVRFEAMLKEYCE